MAFQGKNKRVLAFSGTGLEHAIAEWENGCGIHKNEEIKKLITKMKCIIAVLKDAEKKQISSEVDRLCLGELKEVAFDAEDLIDELATNAAVQSTVAHTYDIATITPSLMDQICQMNSRDLGIDLGVGLVSPNGLATGLYYTTFTKKKTCK